MKRKAQSAHNQELYLEASTAWEKRKLKQAFKLFSHGAEHGFGPAQHTLAYFYQQGIGVKKSPSTAIVWYKRAWATDRHPSTCCNLAMLYLVEGERREAVKWWSKAVTAQDGEAALDLARYYLTLEGDKPASRRKAVTLLKRATKMKSTTPDGRREAKRLIGRIAEIKTPKATKPKKKTRKVSRKK